jgi:hypothetical protein
LNHPSTRKTRRAFVVQLRAEPGIDGIRSFRALLKVALRRHGLRAIDVREIDERAFVFPSHPPRSTRETPMSEFSERILRNSTKGFYRADDLKGGREVTHVIHHLDEEMVMYGKTKDILNFSDTGKQMDVNQTNAEWLIDNLGDDPEKWPGQSVTLYLAPYTYEGETKMGIRLKKAAAKEGVVILPTRGDGASKNPANRKADLDDEIPF